MICIALLLLLTGCAGQRQQEQLPGKASREKGAEPVNAGAAGNIADKGKSGDVLNRDSAVTRDKEGMLHFNLSDAAQIRIQSGSGNEGILVTDPVEVKDISGSLSEFKPYTPEENYTPEYDYTLTFYTSDNMELATVKAYDNFIISYEGDLYYDEAEAFYLWKIRKPYIEEMKATFSLDKTSFRIDGEVYDLQKLESGINAITEYFWFGQEDLPEPMLFLEGHISPYISYGAVFDVEKMDFVFKAYGTDFAYEPSSAASLIYVFQDTVYNYWGSSLYHNEDETVYIYGLEYGENDNRLVRITLSSKTEEKTGVITRLNYYHITDPEQENDPRPRLLSELQADLTHDGEEDIIRISGAASDPELTFGDVLTPDGKTRLWTETAHTAHAGWNSIYLSRKNGEDYLLVFNPYQSTGLADFTYVLFYIKGKDKLDIVDSGSYSFSYGAAKGSENAFDEAKFRAFADKLNTYLKDSYLVLSTEGGTLRYSTPEKHLLPSEQYGTEKWLREIKEELY